MVTVHYNGSLIVSPDMAQVQKQKEIRYRAQDKCKYGRKCHECPVYVKYYIDHPVAVNVKIEFICCLGTSPLCPFHVQNIENGKKEKRYSMTNRHYVEIADRVAYMKENAKNKMLFLTLTLPPFKKNINPKNVEYEINKFFSKFIENLSKNYGLNHYLAVREGNGVTKRYHYHLIAVLPFTDFRKLNSAWCNAISNICETSKNALTTDREARFIKSTSSAVRYICKYISKARGQKSKTRIIFCDRETAQAEIKHKIDYSEHLQTNEVIKSLVGRYKSVVTYQLNDYVTRVTIRDRKELDDFIHNTVRYLFDFIDTGSELYHFSPE